MKLNVAVAIAEKHQIEGCGEISLEATMMNSKFDGDKQALAPQQKMEARVEELAPAPAPFRSSARLSANMASRKVVEKANPIPPEDDPYLYSDWHPIAGKWFCTDGCKTKASGAPRSFLSLKTFRVHLTECHPQTFMGLLQDGVFGQEFV